MKRARTIGLNLALLLFGVFPLWYLGRWSLASLVYGPQGGNVFAGLLFNLVTASGPLVIGGVAQQTVVALLPPRLPAWKRRALAYLSVLLVIASLVFFQYDPESLIEPVNLAPMLTSLALYGALMRIPTGRSEFVTNPAEEPRPRSP